MDGIKKMKKHFLLILTLLLFIMDSYSQTKNNNSLLSDDIKMQETKPLLAIIPAANKSLSFDIAKNKRSFYIPNQLVGKNAVRYYYLNDFFISSNSKSSLAKEKRARLGIYLIKSKTSLNNVAYNFLCKGLFSDDDKDLKGTYTFDPYASFITDTKGDPSNRFNMYVFNGAVFNVDESQAKHFNNYEAYVTHRLMANFISGNGAENYNFPCNGIISSRFLESDILKDALKKFNAGIVKPGESYQSEFKVPELAKDFLRTGTMFSSITGLVGSGLITIKETDANNLVITIFNITSITSGDILKKSNDDSNWIKSYVRDPNKITPYGNISQTYNLLIPNPYKK